jgi:hypothetical protein
MGLFYAPAMRVSTLRTFAMAGEHAGFFAVAGDHGFERREHEPIFDAAPLPVAALALGGGKRIR